MKDTRKEIRTEIVIKASPKVVWKILTDFENYPIWNPFIKKISGEVKVNHQLTAHIEPPGAKGMTFKPTVLRAETNKEFSWLGHLWVKGLFDGEHIFELYENTDGSCTFVQRELFSGLLIPLFTKMLDTNTPEGFMAMNMALKARAEDSLNS